MRLIVDANILICLNGFDRWQQVFSFLDNCDLTMVTIESVYRSELGDTVRIVADQMIKAGCLVLASDPDKQTQQSKSTRKLRKQIIRRARRCRPTSAIDQQLLLIAVRDCLPLATDERPLQHLASQFNHEPVYDLLDIIEALNTGGAIDTSERNNLLDANPGGRESLAEELNQELLDRGGPERFGCDE